MIVNGELALDTIQASDLEQIRVARNGEWFSWVFQYKFINPPRQEEWYKEVFNKPDEFWFVVRRRIGRIGAKSELVGMADITFLNLVYHRAMLGVGIMDEYQRQGIALRSSVMLLKYGFEELNLHKMDLEVLDFNKSAIALYEKLGFKHDGTRRDQYFTGGKYVNVHMMSMIKHEYHQATEEYHKIYTAKGWPLEIEFRTSL